MLGGGFPVALHLIVTLFPSITTTLDIFSSIVLPSEKEYIPPRLCNSNQQTQKDFDYEKKNKMFQLIINQFIFIGLTMQDRI